jgi:hypothetical protein
MVVVAWCAPVELFGVWGTNDFDPVPALQLDILDGLGIPLPLVSGHRTFPRLT